MEQAWLLLPLPPRSDLLNRLSCMGTDSSLIAELITLSQWMASEFSNMSQSQDQPREFAHIHVFFRPLAFDFFQGLGFYSEQVYDYDLWTPYRQGIHHLVLQDDQIYVKNYGLKNALRYAGSGREPSILRTIKPDDIQERCGCAMVFRRAGDQFLGQVEPGKRCVIPKEGRQTYLVSEVEMTESTWISRDRGYDVETDEQVWGSESGVFQFEKRQSFAAELPLTELLASYN
jgi:CpeT protein